MSLLLTNGKELIYNGDTISLSYLPLAYSPEQAYYLSNDLGLESSSKPGQLVDRLDDTAVAVVRHDSRRYPNAHALWHIILVNEERRRPLELGDVVAFRHAGTKRLLTATKRLAGNGRDRDTCLVLTESNGAPTDISTQFFLRPATTSFVDQTLITSGSSIQIISCTEGHNCIAGRSLMTPTPATETEGIMMSTKPVFVPDIAHSDIVDKDLSNLHNTPIDDVLTSLDALRLEALILGDLFQQRKQANAQSGDVLGTTPSMDEIRARLEDLSKEKQVLLNQLSKLQPVLSQLQPSVNAGPTSNSSPESAKSSGKSSTEEAWQAYKYLHFQAVLTGSVTNPAWVISLRGSSIVPSGVLRGCDMVSLGTLGRPRADMLMPSELATGSLSYAVLATSERDLSKYTELYFRRSQLNATQSVAQEFKRLLRNLSRMTPPSSLTSNANSITDEGTNRMTSNLTSETAPASITSSTSTLSGSTNAHKAPTASRAAIVSEEMSAISSVKDDSCQQDSQQQRSFSWEHFFTVSCTHGILQSDHSDHTGDSTSSSSNSSTSTSSSTSSSSILRSSPPLSLSIQCTLPDIPLDQYEKVVKHFAQVAMNHKHARQFLPFSPFSISSLASHIRLPKKNHRRPLPFRLSSKHLHQQQQDSWDDDDDDENEADGNHRVTNSANGGSQDDDDDDAFDRTNPECLLADIRVALYLLDHNLGDCNRLILYRYANKLIRHHITQSESSDDNTSTPPTSSSVRTHNEDEAFYDNYTVNIMTCLFAQQLLSQISTFMALSSEVAFLATCYSLGTKAIDLIKLNDGASDEEKSRVERMRRDKILALFGDADALTKIDGCLSQLRNHLNISPLTPEQGDGDNSRSPLPSTTPASDSMLSSSLGSPALIPLLPPAVSDASLSSPLLSPSSSSPKPFTWVTAKDTLPSSIQTALQQLPKPDLKRIMLSLKITPQSSSSSSSGSSSDSSPSTSTPSSSPTSSPTSSPVSSPSSSPLSFSPSPSGSPSDLTDSNSSDVDDILQSSTETPPDSTRLRSSKSAKKADKSALDDSTSSLPKPCPSSSSDNASTQSSPSRDPSTVSISLVLDQSSWLKSIANLPFLTTLSLTSVSVVPPSLPSSSSQGRRKSIIGINPMSTSTPAFPPSSPNHTPSSVPSSGSPKGVSNISTPQPSKGSTCPLLALSALSLPLSVCSLGVDLNTTLTTLEQIFNHRLPWGIAQYKLLTDHIQRLNYAYPRPSILCPSSCKALSSLLSSDSHNQQSTSSPKGSSSHMTATTQNTESLPTGLQSPHSTSNPSSSSAVTITQKSTPQTTSAATTVPSASTSSPTSSLFPQTSPSQLSSSVSPINHKDCPDCTRLYHTHLTNPPSTLSYLRSVVASPYQTPDHALIPENRPHQPSSMWVIEIVDPNPVDTVTYMAMTDHMLKPTSIPSSQLDEDRGASSYTMASSDSNDSSNTNEKHATSATSNEETEPLDLASSSSTSKTSKSLKVTLYNSLPLSCAPITSSTLVRFRNILTGDYLGIEVGQAVTPGFSSSMASSPSFSASSPPVPAPTTAPLNISAKALSILPSMGILVGVPPQLAADLPSFRGRQLFIRDTCPHPDPSNINRQMHHSSGAATLDINRTKDWYKYCQQRFRIPPEPKDKDKDKELDSILRSWGKFTSSSETELEPKPKSTMEVEPQEKTEVRRDKFAENKEDKKAKKETVHDSTSKRTSSNRSWPSSKSNARLSDALSFEMYISDERDRWSSRQSDPSFTIEDWLHLMDHDTVLIPEPTFTDNAALYEYEPPRCLWDVEDWVSKYDLACEMNSFGAPGPLYATVFTIDPCSLSTLGSMKIDFRSRSQVELSEHDYDKEEVRILRTQGQTQAFYVTGSDVGEPLREDDNKKDDRKNDLDVSSADNEVKERTSSENGKGLTGEMEDSPSSSYTAATVNDKRLLLKDRALDMTRITLKLFRPPESNYPATEFDPRIGRDYIDINVPPVVGAGLSLLVKRLDTRGRNLLHWVQERRGVLLSFEFLLVGAVGKLSGSIKEIGLTNPFKLTTSQVKTSPLLSRYNINMNTNILKSFKRTPKRVTRRTLSGLMSLLKETLPYFEASGRFFVAACCDLARICVLDTYAEAAKSNSKTHPRLDVSNLRGAPLAHIQELIYDMRIINILTRILGRIVTARKEIVETLSTVASSLPLSSTGVVPQLSSSSSQPSSPPFSYNAIMEAWSRLSPSSPTLTEDVFGIFSLVAAFYNSFFDERIIPALLSVIKHVAWRSWEMQLVLTQTPRFGTMFNFELSWLPTKTYTLNPRMMARGLQPTTYLSYVTNYAVWDKQTRTTYTTSHFIATYVEPLNRTRLTEVSSGFGSMVEGSDQGRGRSDAGWCLYKKSSGTMIAGSQGLRTNVMGTLPIDTPYRLTIIWFLLQLAVDSVNLSYGDNTIGYANDTSRIGSTSTQKSTAKAGSVGLDGSEESKTSENTEDTNKKITTEVGDKNKDKMKKAKEMSKQRRNEEKEEIDEEKETPISLSISPPDSASNSTEESGQPSTAARADTATRIRRSSRPREQLSPNSPPPSTPSSLPSPLPPSSPSTLPLLATLARTSPLATRQLVLCIRSILRNNLLVLDRFALSTSSSESLSSSSTSNVPKFMSTFDRATLMERYTYLDGAYTEVEIDESGLSYNSKAQAHVHCDIVPRCHLRRSIDPSAISLIFNPELVQLGLPDLTDLFVAFCIANGRGGLTSCQPPLLNALLLSEELQPSSPTFLALYDDNKSTSSHSQVSLSSFSSTSPNSLSGSSSTSTPSITSSAITRSTRLSRLSSLFRLIRYVCLDNEEAVEKFRACPNLDLQELVDLMRSLLHITHYHGEKAASGNSNTSSGSDDIPLSSLSPTSRVEHVTPEEIHTVRSLSVLIDVLWMTPFPPPSKKRLLSKDDRESDLTRSSSDISMDAPNMMLSISREDQSDDDDETSSTVQSPVQELRRRVASQEVLYGCQGIVTIDLPLPRSALTSGPKGSGPGKSNAPFTESKDVSTSPVDTSDLNSPSSSPLSPYTSPSPSPSPSRSPSHSPQVTRIHRPPQVKSNSRSRSRSRSRSTGLGNQMTNAITSDLYTITDQVVVEAYKFTIDYLQSIVNLTLTNPLTNTNITITSSSPTSTTSSSSSTSSPTQGVSPLNQSYITPIANPQVFHSLLFTSQMKWISTLLPFLSVVRPSHIYVPTSSGSNANTSAILWSDTAASFSQASPVPDDLKLCVGDPLTEIARLIFILLRRVVDSPDHEIAFTVSAAANERNARRCEALATACNLLGRMLRAIQVRAIEQQLQKVVQAKSQAKDRRLGTATSKQQQHIARTPSQSHTPLFVLTSPSPHNEPGNLEMADLNQNKQNEVAYTSIIPTPEQAYRYIVREESSATRHLHTAQIDAKGVSNELARVLFRLFHYNSTDLQNAVSSLLFQLRETALPDILVVPIPLSHSPYPSPIQSSSLFQVNHPYVTLLARLSACVSRASYESFVLQGTTADLSPLASALTSIIGCIRQYDGSPTGKRAKAALRASYAKLLSSFGLKSQGITSFWILQGVLTHLGLPDILEKSLARLTQRLGSSRSLERQFDTTKSMVAGLQLLDAIADLYIFMCSGNERTTSSIATASFATVLLETLRHLNTLEQTSRERTSRIKAGECMKKVTVLLSLLIDDHLLKEIPRAATSELAALYVEQPQKCEIAVLLCRLLSPTYVIQRNQHNSKIVSHLTLALLSIFKEYIDAHDAKKRSLSDPDLSPPGPTSSSQSPTGLIPSLTQSSSTSSPLSLTVTSSNTPVIIPLRLKAQGPTKKRRRIEEQNKGPSANGAILDRAYIAASPSRPNPTSDTDDDTTDAPKSSTSSSLQYTASTASQPFIPSSECTDKGVSSESNCVDVEARCASLIDQVAEMPYAPSNSVSPTSSSSTTTTSLSSLSSTTRPSKPSSLPPLSTSGKVSSSSRPASSSSARLLSSSSSSGSRTATRRQGASREDRSRSAMASDEVLMLDSTCEEGLLVLHLLASCSHSARSPIELLGQRMLPLSSLERILLSDGLPIVAEAVLIHFMLYIHLGFEDHTVENDLKRHDSVVTTANQLIPVFRKRLQSHLPSVISHVTPEFVFLLDVYSFYLSYVMRTVTKYNLPALRAYSDSNLKNLTNEASIACSDIVGIIHNYGKAMVKIPLGLNASPLKLLIQLKLTTPQLRAKRLESISAHYSMHSEAPGYIPLTQDKQATTTSLLSSVTPKKPVKTVTFQDTPLTKEEAKSSNAGAAQGIETPPVDNTHEASTPRMQSSSPPPPSSPSAPGGTCPTEVVLTISSSSSPSNETNQQTHNEEKANESTQSKQNLSTLEPSTLQASESDKSPSLASMSTPTGNTGKGCTTTQSKDVVKGSSSLLDDEYQFLSVCATNKASEVASLIQQGLIGMPIMLPSFMGSGYTLSNFNGCSLTECGGQDFLIQQLEDLDRYLKGYIASTDASNTLLSALTSDKSTSSEQSVSHKSPSIMSPSSITSRLIQSQLQSFGSVASPLEFSTPRRGSMTSSNNGATTKRIYTGTFDVILFERLTSLISESYSITTSTMDSIKLGFVEQFVDLLLQTSIYSTRPSTSPSASSATTSHQVTSTSHQSRLVSPGRSGKPWLTLVEQWLKLGVGRIAHEKGDLERFFGFDTTLDDRTQGKGSITEVTTTTVSKGYTHDADANDSGSESDEMDEDGGMYEKKVDRQANRHPDYYIPDPYIKDLPTGMKIRKNLGKLGLIRVSLRLIESGIDVGRADVTTQGLRLAVLLLEDSDKEICQAFAAELKRHDTTLTAKYFIPGFNPLNADFAMMTVEILTRLCHNAFLPGQQVLLRTYPDAGDPASNLLCLIVEITSLIQGHLSTHLLSLACDPSASSITPYEVGFYFYYGTACTHLVTSVTSGFVKPSQTLIAKRLDPKKMTAFLYALCGFRPLRFSLKEPLIPMPDDDRLGEQYNGVFKGLCPYVTSTVIERMVEPDERALLKITHFTIHMLSMLIEGHEDEEIFSILLHMVTADLPYYIHLLKYHHYAFNCVNQTWYTRRGVEIAYDYLDTCVQLYGLLSSLAEFSQCSALNEHGESIGPLRKELINWQASSPDIRRLIGSVEVVLANNHLTRVYFPIPRPFILGQQRVRWIKKLQEETIANCANIDNSNQRLTEFQRVSLDFSTAIIEDYHSLIRFRSWGRLLGCKTEKSKVLYKTTSASSASRIHRKTVKGPIMRPGTKGGDSDDEGDDGRQGSPASSEPSSPMTAKSKGGSDGVDDRERDPQSDDDIDDDDDEDDEGSGEGSNDRDTTEGKEIKGDARETGRHALDVTGLEVSPTCGKSSCGGSCCTCEGCIGCGKCCNTTCCSSNNDNVSESDYSNITTTTSSCCCGSSTCCSTSSPSAKGNEGNAGGSDSVCCCISRERGRTYYKYHDNRVQSRCMTPRQVIRADCWWRLSFIVAILANLCVLAAALKSDDDFGPIPWRYNWVGVASQVLSVMNLIANFFVTWNFITPQCILLAKEWRRSGNASNDLKAYEILGWRGSHRIPTSSQSSSASSSTNNSKDGDHPRHSHGPENSMHSQSETPPITGNSMDNASVDMSTSSSSSTSAVGSSARPPTPRSERRRYELEQAKTKGTCATCRSAWRWCGDKMKDRDATIFSGPFSPIIIFRVLCLLSAGLSIYPPLRYLLVVTLFEVVVHNSTITYVLVAATSRLRHIIVTIVLFTFIVYSFTIVAFVYLTDNKHFYNFGEEDLAFSCDTNLFDCFQKHFDNAFRNLPVWYEGTTIPVFSPLYSFLFWFIATIMTAIITGIIIDVFGDMRQAKEDAVKAVSEKCFICQIDRGTFQVNRIPFRQHVQLEHNLWTYIALRHHLNVKLIRRPVSMSSVESYLQQAFDQHSVSIYPQDRAMSVDRAEKQKAAGSFFKATEEDWGRE